MISCCTKSRDFAQRDYIHNNPVEAGFVTNPIDWKYSSARNYAEDDTVLKIDNEGMHLGMM